MALKVIGSLKQLFIIVVDAYLIGRALMEMERKQLLAAACYMHVEREQIARSFIDTEW